jgi:hypothetical protein
MSIPISASMRLRRTLTDPRNRAEESNCLSPSQSFLWFVLLYHWRGKLALLRYWLWFDGYLSVHPSSDLVANAGNRCVQAIELVKQFGEQKLLMGLDHSNQRFLKGRQVRSHLAFRQIRQLNGIGLPRKSSMQHRTS